MSQISIEKEDNRSVAASDFVQLDQPDEMPYQQETQHQQEQHPHFGLHQNALDWTMDTGTGSSTHNYGNDLKEHKLMIANLEAKNQTLQAKVENLELKAQIRAMKEDAEQKANYQALEAKMNGFEKMLSTQTDQMAQLESKNRKLEEELRNVELQTKENGAFKAEMMEELKDEFSKMLSEQQKQMMAQFQKLLLGYDCARAALVEMANKLTVAETKQQECEKMNATLRMTLWKSFPSAHLNYYINIPAFGYICANDGGFLHTSGNPLQEPMPCVGYFKFTKHSDGSFSIYSVSKGKYLQKHPSLSPLVYFAADECGTADTKFVFVFHPQEEQHGFMVDIHSLAHDSYLAKGQSGHGNLIEANSRTAPDSKFLIIPVLDGQ